MTVSSDFIEELIKTDHTVDSIWECLLEIWNPKEYDEYKNYYENCEEKTLELEKMLDVSFPKLYSEILPSMCEPNISGFSEPIVWLDGMSIREGRLLADNLDLKIDGPNFSAIPSETAFYRDPLPISPTIVQNHTDPTLRGNEKHIWCPIPDRHFSKVKGNDPAQYDKIIEDLEIFILSTKRKLNSEKFTILSDHGYIDITRSQREGKSIERKMKDILEGERYTNKDKNKARELEEDGYLVKYGDYFLVKGRRHWTKRGKYMRFPHGGVSLMECLTPILKI